MPVLSSEAARLDRKLGIATPGAGGGAGAAGDVDRILKLEVPVIVKLAERRLSMAEVMRIGVGAIIEFSKSSEEPLELMINNKTIGVGDAVKVGENFGLRVAQVGDVKDLVAALGGR